MSIKTGGIAYEIADAIRLSNYQIIATGMRDVGSDELVMLIQTIIDSNKFDIKNNLEKLYNSHPDTIEMNRSFFETNCESYDADNCDCFLPGVEHEDCWCKRQRKAYLETTDYRNTPEYKAWRKAVFKKDKYICQDCSKVGGELNAHHIKKYKDYPKDRYQIENGITLCVECHKARHKNEQ